MAGAVTLVAPVLLLATLPGKMAESVALVALAAAVTAAAKSLTISAKSASKSSASATPTVTVVHSISFGTLAGKMANPVTAVTHGAPGPLTLRTFASKVTSPGRIDL